MSNCGCHVLRAILVGLCLAGCTDVDRWQEVGKRIDPQFRFGDRVQWATAELTPDWKSVNLEEGWRAQSFNGSGWVGRRGWYRWRLHLPETPPEGGLMLSAGYVGNNSELFVNGTSLGGWGSIDTLDGARPRTVHAVEVDRSQLNWGAENVIAVRVRNVAGDGGILGGPVGLFSSRVLLPEIRRLEGHRDWMKILVAALCLGLAVVFTITWLAGERSLPWLHATMLMLCGATAEVMSTSLAEGSGLGVGAETGRSVWLVLIWAQPLLTLYAIRKLCRQPHGLWDWIVWGVAVLALTRLLVPVNQVQAAALTFVLLLMATGAACLRHMLAGRRLGVALATPLLVASLAIFVAVTAQVSLLFVPWLPAAALWWEPLDWGVLFHSSWVGAALVREGVRARKREQSLAARLQQAGVEERARIGRHLHDYLVQDLEYLHFRAQAAASENQDPPTFHGEVNAVTKRVIQSARRMAEDLQPLALRGVGLPTALRELAKLLKERHGSQVEVDIEDSLDGLSERVAEGLYRAAHEAASNAAQHAEAGRVVIRLTQIESDPMLEVEDDGIGFDLEEAQNHGRLGLRFLKDHAEASGARLEIKSKAGVGTCVRFRLPGAGDPR